MINALIIVISLLFIVAWIRFWSDLIDKQHAKLANERRRRWREFVNIVEEVDSADWWKNG